MDDEATVNVAPSTSMDDQLQGKEPLPFPVYSLHGGKTDSLHIPCGNVPLLFYWGKKPRPLIYNRQCGEIIFLSSLR